MSIWGSIFGSKKAISDAGEVAKNVSSGIVAGIDKAFYTSEEKAENAAKRFETISTLIIALQDQFTPRSISRRVVAVVFCLNFTIAFLLSVGLAAFGKTDAVNLVVEVVRVYMLGQIILTIIFFYFGYYGVSKVLGGLKKEKP